MSSDTCSGTPLSWFCHCSVAYWTRSIAAAIRRVLCERANPTMSTALARHWPEYAMEAWGLGLFMAAAGLFGVLLYHPASPTAHAVADPFVRRRDMDHPRGAALGDEHEPGAEPRLRPAGEPLDRVLDLPRGSAARHAAGR